MKIANVAVDGPVAIRALAAWPRGWLAYMSMVGVHADG